MSPAEDLDRMVTAFAERVPDVAHAAVVSRDGLPLASSSGLGRDRVDQLSAVTSGLTKLVQGAARIFSAGSVARAVVVMERGMLITMPISGNSVLAVLAAPECDMGQVVYEMTLLGEQAARRPGPGAARTAGRQRN
jgi:uncharacterized protein